MDAPRLLYWSALVGWALIEVRNSIVRTRGDRASDAGTFPWARRTALVLVVAVLVLDRLVPPVVSPSEQGPFLVAGAVVVAVGVALRLWAIGTLGRYFTYQVTTIVDQRVATAGPYRWVRHPSYTGLLAACLGAGLGTANLASLAVIVGVSAYGTSRRIGVEERVLLRALGDEYRDFCASRKRLIPGIW